jgi:copper(I)-binding protein
VIGPGRRGRRVAVGGDAAQQSVDPSPAPAQRDRRSRARVWSGAVVAALVVLSPAAAGCGAGQRAATAEQVSGSSGATAQVGEMAVLDVEFPFDRPIAGDEVYPVGGTAPLAITVVNTGRVADRLVGVSSPIATAGIAVADELVVPGGRTLTAGQTGPVAAIEVPYEDDEPLIALTGLRVPVRSGVSYPVTFRFERAGEVVLDVPVGTPEAPR